MSAQSDAIIAALEKEIATACKALVLQLDRNLRATTPVLTGHARASWVPSIGEPSSALPEGASTAEREAGVAAVLSYRLDQGALYVSTNVAYMPFLNLGRSNQAPAGFIEVAIDRAEQTVNAKYAGRITIDATSGRAAAGAANLADAYSPFGGSDE